MYLVRRLLPELVPDDDSQNAPLRSNTCLFDLDFLSPRVTLTPQSAQRSKFCPKLRRHHEFWPLERCYQVGKHRQTYASRWHCG